MLAVESSVSGVRVVSPAVSTGASLTVLTTMLASSDADENGVALPVMLASTVLPAALPVPSQAR